MHCHSSFENSFNSITFFFLRNFHMGEERRRWGKTKNSKRHLKVLLNVLGNFKFKKIFFLPLFKWRKNSKDDFNEKIFSFDICKDYVSKQMYERQYEKLNMHMKWKWKSPPKKNIIKLLFSPSFLFTCLYLSPSNLPSWCRCFLFIHWKKRRKKKSFSFIKLASNAIYFVCTRCRREDAR